MNVENVEYFFSLSIQNDQQAIREAEAKLLNFIHSAESIPIFLQIIQSTNNHTYATASFIYLNKAIQIQWNCFSTEEKANLQSTLLNLYFQYKPYRKKIVYILHFFLQNSENLESFLPFLTTEITPENIIDLTDFYSSIIELLPQPFLENQKDYILNLISKSFDLTKDIANDTNIIDIKISTFHISSISTLLFKDPSIILPQINPICEILVNCPISDTYFTLIVSLFKQFMPSLLNFADIQYFYFTIVLTISENKNISYYRRSTAIESIIYLITNNILDPKSIFRLIDLSFDILVSNLEEMSQFQSIFLVVLFNSIIVIPENEIYEYVTSIEEKSLISNSVDLITAGIILISTLIYCCPNSFLEHQESQINVLANFLNGLYPRQIVLSVLMVLQDVSAHLQLFPLVFSRLLLPLIFNSQDEQVSYCACSALFHLTSFNTFNHKEFFQILWSDREELIKRNINYFMEILFQVALGLDDIERSVKNELMGLVIHFLNPETDTNLLSSVLLLSISILEFNEEPNIDILNGICMIIENALKIEDMNLFKVVMQFLYIFISQLKYQSFELLKGYSNKIIESVLSVNIEQTLFAGAAIVKYWNCPQIKPKIYQRLVMSMKKSNILFLNENSQNNDYLDDGIKDLMIKGQFSYYRILAFLVKFLEPNEAYQIFDLALKSAIINFNEVLPLLKKLVKHVHPENYNEFTTAFFKLVNISLTTQNYVILSLMYELSTRFLALPTNDSAPLISEFIENLKCEMKNPELSFEHKDSFIGIFSDAIVYHKIFEEQAKDLFALIYSIVFQKPPKIMWQNIAYFINIAFSNYPDLIGLQDFQSSIQNFIQVLLSWLMSSSSNSDDEINMIDTCDNIASLLLTIISLSKLNDESVLEMAIGFFPPHDTTEMVSMASRIIEIYQLNPPMKSCCLISEAIVRFLTMGIKMKRKVNVGDEMVQSLIAILKRMLTNNLILEYVVSRFNESPEKVEFIKNLL